MPGLEKLSSKDLELIASGDLDNLSTEALSVVASYGELRDAPASPQQDLSQFALEGIPAKSAPPEEFLRGLLTNEPTKGLGGFVGRNILPAIGGGVGATAGAGVASVPTAALGGVAGESVRQTLVRMANRVMGIPNPPAEESAGAIAESGLAQAGGQVLGTALSTGVKALAPGALKAGGQVIRVLTGVKPKLGEAALGGALKGAPSKKAASELYSQFTDKLGLKSLDEALPELTGKIIPGPSDFESIVNSGYKKLAEGTITEQEALFASQAANKLKELAKLGRSEYAGAKMQLNQAKEAFDSFLEGKLPGFKGVREAYFKSKVREAFTPLLPQNVNQSPNVLRTYGGLTAAGAGLASGNPLLALIPAFQSPLLVGTAIRGTQAVGSLLRPALGPALRLGSQVPVSR